LGHSIEDHPGCQRSTRKDGNDHAYFNGGDQKTYRNYPHDENCHKRRCSLKRG
jgi:hypothetical protein